VDYKGIGTATMPRASEKQLQKISLRLYQSDVDALKIYYPSAGYNRIIRGLVSRHVRELDAAYEAKRKGEPLATKGVTLNDLRINV
jgi:hypothetical protein